MCGRIILDLIHEWRDAVISIKTSFITCQSTAFVDCHGDESASAGLTHLDIPRANERNGSFEWEMSRFDGEISLDVASRRQGNDNVAFAHI